MLPKNWQVSSSHEETSEKVKIASKKITFDYTSLIFSLLNTNNS